MYFLLQSGSVGVVECHPGYELPTGFTHFHLSCGGDEWTATNEHGGIESNVSNHYTYTYDNNQLLRRLFVEKEVMHI